MKDCNYKLNIENTILISDIHNTYKYLEKAINIAKDTNKTLIINGDIFDRGTFPLETLKLIHQNLDLIEIIIGNHDDMLYHALKIYENNDFKSEVLNMTGLFLANDYNNNTLYGLLPNSSKFIPASIHDSEFLNKLKQENIETINMLIDIKNKSRPAILHEENIYKDYLIRISHTGNMTSEPGDIDILNFYWDLEPTLELQKHRKDNNIIDICGHWSQLHLMIYLEMIDVDFLLIDDSVFVPSWNALYIDNGCGSNIVMLKNMLDKIIQVV